MGEFSNPLFLSPLLSFFSYPSNIEIINDLIFSDIITKIHPPYQNPGSALDEKLEKDQITRIAHLLQQSSLRCFVSIIDKFLDLFQFCSHFVFTPGRDNGSGNILTQVKKNTTRPLPERHCD